MHPDSIPVPHGNQTLYLGPVTDKVQQRFCAWLRPRYILEAMEAADEAKAENKEAPGTFTEEQIRKLDVNAELARATANAKGIAWSADPSPPVAAALNTEAGTIRLARLMFADDPTVKAWTDAELYDYLRVNGERGTAYDVAFQIQWKAASPDPKARPAGTSAGTTVTPGSTSSSPAPTPSA